MKKSVLIVAGLLIVAFTVTFAPLAGAQTPAPTTCSTALQALVAAQQKAVLTQAEVDRLKAAQTPLDAAVQKAKDALAAATDPLKIPELQALLTVATNLANVGNDKLNAAITADAAADAAVVAAQAAADKGCQGAPGATVTMTPPPPAPVVVTIPSAINTGYAA